MAILHINFPHWLNAINGRILHSLSYIKVLWKVWNLRGFTILSLTLQIILIFFAPFRKQTANLSVIVSIWLAYLLADYIATQAVGLIPNYGQKYYSGCHNATLYNQTLAPHEDLLAFWSPFLLVHLGGPDTITALALEDNELWMRTGLHLCTQVTATGRVFFQSLPSSLLWLPTILMFVAGILKYMERLLSLYYARLTKFKSSMLKKPDPGPNYAKLMESYDSYLKSKLPAKFNTNPEPDQYKGPLPSEAKGEENEDDDLEQQCAEDPAGSGKICEPGTSWPIALFIKRNKQGNKRKNKNLQMVRDAFAYFEKYKGLYVDMIFSFRDRSETREDFLKRTSKEAFLVIETELNFTYEVFFTKMVVIHQRFGTVIRCISCACEVLSLLVWSLFIPKNKFSKRDIEITYALLLGAIVLDVVAVLRVLLSDWKIALLSKESERRASVYDKLLSFRKRTWGKCRRKKDCDWITYLRRTLFRRWSESVLQFNLITYCVDPWSKWAHYLFIVLPLQDKFDAMVFVSKEWFTDDLRDFIFDEIKYKAEVAEDPTDAEEVCQSTGDWVLRSLAGLSFDPFDFYPWTDKAKVAYDECLLVWHVATELLYQEEEREKKKKKEEEEEAEKENKDKEEKENFFNRFLLKYNARRMRTKVGGNDKEKEEEEDSSSKKNGETTEEDYRRYCKTLSDYMMYLLNQQPEMMLSVAGITEVRFRDTCAEAIKFFDRVLPKSTSKPERQMEACERIMSVNTEVDPKDIKGDRSKSVLFDACRLAKKLKLQLKPGEAEGKSVENKEVGMWELMAKVWVELVSYSATHCRANAHAAQLKQGGELLTIVWLLMVHFGLGTQFRITQGNARSKLIITK